MTLIADRVFETTTTPGSGTLTLLGAVIGFQAFRDGFTNGDTVFYTIIQNDGVDGWEAGIGTLTVGSPDTLSRDKVLASSNSNAAVNFGTGAKNVLGVPASAFFAGPAAGFSGTARPDWLRAGGRWLDTTVTPWILKLFDGAGDIPIASIDPNTGRSTPYFEGKLLPHLPRGYIEAFTLTNNGVDSAHDLDVTAFRCRDSSDAGDIVIAADLTKRMDALFTEGNDGGGLDVGALTPNTDYDLYAIGKDDGTGDIVGSTASSALARPSGFSRETRVATFRTDGSGNIVNDLFRKVTPIGETVEATVSASAGTSITLAPGLLKGMKRFKVHFLGVQTANANNEGIIQIGPSGGVETAGYVGSVEGSNNTGSNGSHSTDGSGFQVTDAFNWDQNAPISGIVSIERVGKTPEWTMVSELSSDTLLRNHHGSGRKAVTGDIEQMLFKTIGGSTFNGSGSIVLEGTSY